MPKISVVIPVYNVENYLSRCIDSVLNQTFSDFELILVDDGSTDKSGEICDKFARSDNRIKVIHCVNRGVSVARNKGIDISTGEYITFIDSDDYILSNCFEMLLKGSSDLIICGYIHKTDNGETIKTVCTEHCNYLAGKIDYNVLYKTSIMYGPCGKLFNSAIIKKNNIMFPENISLGEDSIFVVDFLIHSESVLTLDYSGYVYVKYDKQTLTKIIDYNTIDLYVKSREYIINRIKGVSGEYIQSISDNIKNNVASTVERLIFSNISYKEKRELLEYFIENDYVKETIKMPEKYYTSKNIRSCITKGGAKQILTSYKKISRAEKVRILKRKVYTILPLWVKRIYSGE